MKIEKEAGRNFTFVLGGSFLWLLFIFHFGSRHLTLSPGWADGVSHLYTTPIFWDHGLDILKRPLKDFVTPATSTKTADGFTLPQADYHIYRGQSSFLVWLDVPRPYPPALYLMMSPVSFLFAKEAITARTALIIMVGFWLLLAHLATVTVFKVLATEVASPIIYLVTLFFYFESVRWVLNSQYDIVALAFAIWSVKKYQERRFQSSLWFLALALFFHLRTLYLGPLFLFCFYHSFKISLKQKNTQRWFLLMIGPALLVVLPLLTLYWNIPFFKLTHLYDLNGMHFSKWGPGNWGKTLGLVMLMTFFSWRWFCNKQWEILACSWMTLGLLVQSRLVREWYVLFLVPVLLLSLANKQTPTEEEIDGKQYRLATGVGLYLAISIFVLNNSPFEFRLIREVLVLLGN